MGEVELGVTVNFGATVAGLEKIAGTPKEPELWLRLAMLQRKNERERVEERMGIDGRHYPESGRAKLDGGYTLIDKGHMVNAMSVRGVTSFGSRLGFNSVTEAMKAGWHHFGTKRGIRRPWWGFAKTDLDTLEEYKNEYLETAIQKSGLAP